MTSKLITELRGSIGYLVLNAPERRNAISFDMWQAIPPAIHSFDSNPQIRCIVVTGAGSEAFAAGADISEFEANRATIESAERYDEATRFAVDAIMATNKPVVAGIRGICYGGGLALAIACDLRFASADARFCIPAARLGVAYGTGGTSVLVDRLGASLAAEVLITARVYSAHDALLRGIVHQVSPVSDYETALNGYISAIVSNAPLSMSASKHALNFVRTRTAGHAELARSWADKCANSDDYLEGRKAFAEKRKPAFKGQ